ncbi:MAG TPA: Tim44 domain-containing protein [Verrucomicrobiae bacterium]|jgi:predicted lipid-binding transport protein (Tim44 family)|nr:Tim44 domain-containing protein [Verrucomicrobiae bacterium]
MKRMTALLALIAVTALPVLWAADAWARAGGGGSSGSRGSRSYSAPAAPSSSPGSSSLNRPAPPPPTSYQQPAPAPRPGWGFGGMLGGLLLGGLIGSLFFGGMGYGGGGIGLLEIVLIGVLAYVAISFLRRRQSAPAVPAGYADPGASPVPWHPEPAQGTAVTDTPAATDADLARGLSHIRQMDPRFDPARFAEPASDIFFRVQAAWMARDMGGVRPVLTEEMAASMQAQCDQLRAQRRVNRLENVAVRAVDLTEAWQERGQDFVSVRFLASLLDFTTDESGTQVIEGSRTEPVKFEEYWTFTRPVGLGAWRLSAIQQAG